MGVPVYTLLVLGGVAVYLLARPGRDRLPETEWKLPREPLRSAERRALAITGLVSLLWMTDGLHHWDPAIPALIGGVAVVTPGLGVTTWQDLERTLGWANLLVIGASLSLAQAMVASGAASWLADWLRLAATPLVGRPLGLAAGLVVACLALRAVLPNISAYLTLLIPVVMELAPDLGLNPLICAMIVTVAGDSVLYYPAQSSSSLIVAERGHLSAGPVVALAVIMALLIVGVLLLLALPYWALLGQPLAVGG
jgi:di/tricarboxylate transporter